MFCPRGRVGPSCAGGRGPRGTFTPMSLTRIASVAVLAGALSLAAGCGGSSVDPDEGALGSTVAPTTTAVTPVAPVPTPTATRTKKSPVSSPTPTAKATSGDGDAVGDDEPATAGGGVCGKLTATEVGTVIGSGVKGEGVAGGGCEFDHADPKLPAATVKDVRFAGMDAAKTEATSSVEGQPEDLSGIGSGAFVVTGGVFGGTEIQGAGAVHVGSRTIQVWIAQHKALSQAAVRTMVVKLLQLVARQAS
jgi:hypothetical protein